MHICMRAYTLVPTPNPPTWPTSPGGEPVPASHKPTLSEAGTILNAVLAGGISSSLPHQPELLFPTPHQPDPGLPHSENVPLGCVER